MENTYSDIIPHRICHLVALKEQGAEVTCRTSFAVVNVEFRHRVAPYEAFVFMCTFRGEVNGAPYEFRKCYARGCLHNLCPHISIAVMIANRYLEQDQAALERAGIRFDKELFTIEGMIVKTGGLIEERERALTIEDCIHMAEQGQEVHIRVEPEYVDAVEHFGNAKTSSVFLTANFHVETAGRTDTIQRCLCCFDPKHRPDQHVERAVVANARLQEIYQRLDAAGVHSTKALFG
ncbi:MAG: hypothetical protein JXB39_09810 [Deltaproteobacteria bacterium]|nr:hypothetical protein [Deltaproteobacteria bacterium]